MKVNYRRLNRFLQKFEFDKKIMAKLLLSFLADGTIITKELKFLNRNENGGLVVKRRLIIDMEADFDTYLSITDMKLKKLYEDDNGGSGTNSKLDITLDVGSYYIEATTAKKNIKGEFTLSILSEEQ